MDKVKEFISDLKVWIAAAVALVSEWAFGIIEILKGFVN